MAFENGGSGRLAGYRLHFLNALGEATKGIDLDCVDDDQAIAVVQEHLIHDRMELWQGERLVKSFGEAG